MNKLFFSFIAVVGALCTSAVFAQENAFQPHLQDPMSAGGEWAYLVEVIKDGESTEICPVLEPKSQWVECGEEYIYLVPSEETLQYYRVNDAYQVIPGDDKDPIVIIKQ